MAEDAPESRILQLIKECRDLLKIIASKQPGPFPEDPVEEEEEE